jgi:hypothetical protein
MYEVQLDDGSTYTTPEHIARDMAPDSFQEQYEQAASGYGGYAPEAPPWEMSAQDAAPVMDFAPDVIEQPPEMTFDEAEAGPVDVFPGSGAQWAAEQGLGAGATGLAPGESVSMSRRGVRPHRGVGPAALPAPPDYSTELGLIDAGTAQQSAAYGEMAAAEKTHGEEQQRLMQEQQRIREDTSARWEESHTNAMAMLEQSEAEIDHAVSQIPRMDPGRVWNNTDNATKFGGIMAAAIAGWLQPGKPNEVINQMHRLMDMDARAQESDIATAKFAVGAAERAYGRLSDRIREDESSYLKRRYFLEQTAIHAIEVEKQKYLSDINRGNLAKMQGKLIADSAETRQKIRQTDYANYLAVADREINQRQHEDRMRIERNRIAEQRAARRAADARKKAELAAQGDVGEALYSFDGKTVYAGREYTGKIGTEERASIRKALTAERSMHRVGKELLFHLQNKDTRTGRLMPSSAAWIDKHLSEFHLVLRPKTGANFTEPERKDLDAFFGNPKGVIKDPDTAAEILKDTLDKSDRRMMELISGYNPQVSTGQREAVDIPGYGQVQRDVYRPMDITESPLPAELTVPELADVVPQHIRKFAEDVGAAAESFNSYRQEVENVRAEIEAPREAPIGADPGYVPDITASKAYQDAQKELDRRRSQVTKKVEQLIDRLEETGLSKDAAVIDEVNAYLMSVEDIIGPQFDSPVARAAEAIEPEPLPPETPIQQEISGHPYGGITGI